MCALVGKSSVGRQSPTTTIALLAHIICGPAIVCVGAKCGAKRTGKQQHLGHQCNIMDVNV
eukprot:5076991-Amphidinium_carterae.1